MTSDLPKRPPDPATHPDVAAALADCRRAFWSVAGFSAVVNLLMLAGPLYMLQIYDRVLSSRSVPTLVALSALLLGAYLFQAILDQIRSRIVVRSAALLDRNLAASVHDAMLGLALDSRHAREAAQPVRDLDQIRGFLTGTGPIAIVDIPWIPIFLLLCGLIHPWLGIASLLGALALAGMAVLTERASRAPARVLAREGGLRMAMIEADRRNSESAAAMGMSAALAARWVKLNERYVARAGRASDIVNSYASVSKVIRLVMQSVILGLGAYFVIRQELTAGAMIAASIMMGRALAPIETAIANWRSFVSARDSVRRLSAALSRLRPSSAVTVLPKPTGDLDVQQVAVVAPGTQTVIVGQVNFRLAAGEAMAIIGPSGAGKTSLARTLVGIWPAARGTVRLDGATPDQWNPQTRGRHIGYVAQDVELFDASVAHNIARMDATAHHEQIIKAARAAGAHDMILRLPAGYDTILGDGGTALSGGQRQRIALARALYGDPFLVVLDEPHANLDNDGETALQQAVLGLKARGAIVVLIAHRPSALAACDKVLVLGHGAQQAFGPRDEVLRKVLVPPRPAPAANLKVVGEHPGTTE